MIDKKLEQLIAEETVASESTRDEAMSEQAVRKGQTRSVVYSVRLTPEQTSQIQRIAATAGIPASGLVRDWVLKGLATEQGDSEVEGLVEALSLDVERLRRRLGRGKAS